MSSVSTSRNTTEILVSESLTPTTRQLLEFSKAYDTIVLLYEDDMSDNVLAAWAETDRLKLNLRKVGHILSGIDVYSFGMDEFPPGTMMELDLREAGQDPRRQDNLRTSYKSLLNELILIQVRVCPNGRDSMLLQ